MHEGNFELPAHSIDRPQRLVWTLGALAEHEAELLFRDVPASTEELERVHDQDYLAGLRALSARGIEARLDPELHAGPRSYEIAAQAAGAVLAETRHVLARGPSEEVRVCLSRPGSHHAGPDYALGFCLVNNLAVAAASALEEKLAERVAIVDFDAHHGNGTEEIFSGESRVLTVSLHQYPFYPGTGAAGSEGAMSNLNLPLPDGTSDDGFMGPWAVAVEKIAGFAPDLILVEAGVDGHLSDWTSGLRLGDSTFRMIGRDLRDLAARCSASLLLEAGGAYTETAARRGIGALLRGLSS